MTICSTKGEKNGNCQASPPDGETHRAEDGTIGGTRSIAPSMSMPSAAARGERRRPAPGREAWIRRAGAGPGGTPEGRHRRESRRAGNAGSACFRGEASDLSRRFSGALHWRRFPPLPSCAPPPRRENGLNGFRPLTVSPGAEGPASPPLPGEKHRNVLPLPVRGLPFLRGKSITARPHVPPRGKSIMVRAHVPPSRAERPGTQGAELSWHPPCHGRKK